MGIFRKKKPETRADTDGEVLSMFIRPDAMTPEKAMAVPAFAACVEFIANSVAALPVRLYKTTEEGTTEEIIDDYRLDLLNRETGDLMDPVQFKKAMIIDYLLCGDAYAYIDRAGNRINGLYYTDSRRVSVFTNEGANPIFKEADFFVNGKRYYDFDFVIIARQSKNGVTGEGLVEQNSDALSTAYNTILFENKMMKSNGNKRGFLQSESELKKDAFDKLKEAWRKLYSSGEEKVMLLNKGLQFKEISATSVEMQLNETKESNNEEICKMCGVSPTVLSGNSSADDYQNSIQMAVMPALSALQAAFNKALLLESEKDRLFFEFDSSELTKGNSIQRAQTYKLAISSGWMTVDEVRGKENMSPLGLDYVRLGLNDVLYDPQAKTIYTPNTNALEKLKGGASGNESGSQK